MKIQIHKYSYFLRTGKISGHRPFSGIVFIFGRIHCFLPYRESRYQRIDRIDYGLRQPLQEAPQIAIGTFVLVVACLITMVY